MAYKYYNWSHEKKTTAQIWYGIKYTEHTMEQDKMFIYVHITY